mgnify:CR=1 FL=1
MFEQIRIIAYLNDDSQIQQVLTLNFKCARATFKIADI